MKSDSKVVEQREGRLFKRIVRVVFDWARRIVKFVRVLQSHRRDLHFVAVVLMLRSSRNSLKKEPKPKFSLFKKE